MNLRFYSQAVIQYRNGSPGYTGQDARPYVSDRLLIVADGLGGTGAARHDTFPSELFDRDAIVEALFKGVCENLDHEDFATYIKDSFVELYPMKEFYAQVPFAVKRSAYFGSRIVSALIMYYVTHNENLNPSNIFDKFAGLDNFQKQNYLSEFGQRLADMLKSDLSKVCDNAQLTITNSESSKNNSLKLLATTLCATIFHERDDDVEALYLMSGDSRPYIWSENGGMCQVIREKERADGAMLGCVHASGDFSIDCQYFRFAKPCVLFNASDGCFDSGKFSKSPMAFEKVLLESIINNASFEEAENELIKFFDQYGRHDDSASLAMRCFGYESYEDFQQACIRRMAYLESEYLSKVEGLLTENYASIQRTSENNLKTAIETVKDRLKSDKAIEEFCMDCITSNKAEYQFPTLGKIATIYSQKMSEIDAAIEEKKERIKASKEILIKLVTENFLCFREWIEFKDRRHRISIEKAERNYSSAIAEYKEIVDSQKHMAESASSYIKSMVEKIDRIGVPSSFASYSELEFSDYEQTKKQIKKICAFLDDLKAKKLTAVTKISSCHVSYLEKGKKLAEAYPEKIAELYDMLIERKIDVSQLDIPDDTKEQITHAIQLINVLSEEIDRLMSCEKVQVLKDAVELLLENDSIDVLIAAIQSGVPMDEDLIEELKPALDAYMQVTDEAKEKAMLQEELLEIYNRQYEKYMVEEV